MLKKIIFTLFFLSWQSFSVSATESISLEVYPDPQSSQASHLPGLYLTHVKAQTGRSSFYLSKASYERISLLLGGKLIGKPMPSKPVAIGSKAYQIAFKYLGWSKPAGQRPLPSSLKDVNLDPSETFSQFHSAEEEARASERRDLLRTALPINIPTRIQQKLVDFSIRSIETKNDPNEPTIHVPGYIGPNNSYCVSSRYKAMLEEFYGSTDLIVIGKERGTFSGGHHSVLSFGLPEERSAKPRRKKIVRDHREEAPIVETSEKVTASAAASAPFEERVDTQEGLMTATIEASREDTPDHSAGEGESSEGDTYNDIDSSEDDEREEKQVASKGRWSIMGF